MAYTTRELGQTAILEKSLCGTTLLVWGPCYLRMLKLTGAWAEKIAAYKGSCVVYLLYIYFY